MEEKGKTLKIESDEEEEGSPTYVEEVNPEEDPIQLVQRPKYVAPSKGKAKVPTNLDEVDTILITPSLPKGVPVESSVVGRIATMKFEDWDLVDTTKFSHLAIGALMEQSAEGMVTALQPKEWLRKVEKVGLLCLLSIPHFLWPPITMLVIRNFLCLVHEDILWIGKPVSITTELVHRILQLPCEGRDPREIVDRSGDVTMIDNLKKKYKLKKGQRGYAIDGISYSIVHITTQLLAGKVMRKCHGSKVPAVVIALVEECAAGEWFNWSQFLFEAFLINYGEVQEEGKTFHYAWMLLSIILVTTDLPEDSQIPVLD